eukprot:Amastigsp_a342263_54.p5 type:complete len:121 gc:universal Amastigsp_a342263_54:629-991(+)
MSNVISNASASRAKRAILSSTEDADTSLTLSSTGRPIFSASGRAAGMFLHFLRSDRRRRTGGTWKPRLLRRESCMTPIEAPTSRQFESAKCNDLIPALSVTSRTRLRPVIESPTESIAEQ